MKFSVVFIIFSIISLYITAVVPLKNEREKRTVPLILGSIIKGLILKEAALQFIVNATQSANNATQMGMNGVPAGNAQGMQVLQPPALRQNGAQMQQNGANNGGVPQPNGNAPPASGNAPPTNRNAPQEGGGALQEGGGAPQDVSGALQEGGAAPQVNEPQLQENGGAGPSRVPLPLPENTSSDSAGSPENSSGPSGSDGNQIGQPLSPSSGEEIEEDNETDGGFQDRIDRFSQQFPFSRNIEPLHSNFFYNGESISSNSHYDFISPISNGPPSSFLNPGFPAAHSSMKSHDGFEYVNYHHRRSTNENGNRHIQLPLSSGRNAATYHAPRMGFQQKTYFY